MRPFLDVPGRQEHKTMAEMLLAILLFPQIQTLSMFIQLIVREHGQIQEQSY